MNLNQKKLDAEAAILKLNDDFIYFSNSTDHQRLECKKLESEKRNISKRDKVRVSSKRAAE